MKYEWESNIKLNISVLRVLGLWPETTYTFSLYSLYATIVLSAFVFLHIASQVINIYFIRTDLEAVTGSVYVLLVEIVLMFKIYYLVTNMGLLKELLEVLKGDMFLPKNSNQMQVIANNLWLWKVIYSSFWYMVIGVNLFWATSPFLDSGKRLIFLAWYPFDVKGSPVYEIMFGYQVFCINFISTIHVNIDALVAALNVFNYSQLDLLRDNLKNLDTLGEDLSTSFVYCVEHHKAILSHADKSNKFLNWIIMVQLLVGGVSLGATLFQMSLVEPMSNEFFSFGVYFIAITLQSFMYCWFGNEIEVKSENVPYALFECDWTDFSNDLKKEILFFTMVLQKPVKLSAFKVFYLSLNTFMKILKTAWSYFALFHQVTLKN